MANEASVRGTLIIKKGSRNYVSRPGSYNANVTGSGGQTPGGLLIGTSHTVIDLSQLTTPGLCRMQNLDPTNSVEIGVYSSHFAVFFPMLELLPGEFTIVRLSQYLGKDLDPTAGTGTADAFTNSLAIKAVTAPCEVLVEAFDR